MSHPHFRDENSEIHWGLVTCPKVMNVMAVKAKFQSCNHAKAHMLNYNANFFSMQLTGGETGEER